LPILNAAAVAIFLVTGIEKAAAVERVFHEGVLLPAGRVRPAEGPRWFLDAEAASRLRPSA
jgi:6-phosphogluconolactonase/glucosamine-6-phosphate isomerase/deaminase